MSTHPRQAQKPRRRRAELIKVVCKECGRSIHQCVCAGGAKYRARQVRVFTEDELREVQEHLLYHRTDEAKQLLADLLAKPEPRGPTVRPRSSN